MGEKQSKTARFTVKQPAETTVQEKNKKYPSYVPKKKKTRYEGGEEVEPQEEKYAKKKPKAKKQLRDVEGEKRVEEEVVPEEAEREVLEEREKEHVVPPVEEYEEEVLDEDKIEEQMKVNYGEYSSPVYQRIRTIITQSRELRSDFEDVMETYMNKLTNLNVMLDDIYRESSSVQDISKKIAGINIAMIRSNYFIGEVIQNVLAQRETLLFLVDDPFFKIIPLYLWRKLEKHYDSIMKVLKKYPDNEESFRRLRNEKGFILSASSRPRPKFQVDRYDVSTEDFNQLILYLEDASSLEKGVLSSNTSIKNKQKDVIKLLGEVDSDAKKSHNHMKSALRTLKDNINDLMGICEQASDNLSDLPPGFKHLGSVSRDGERKRKMMKENYHVLKATNDSIVSKRTDLENLWSSPEGKETSQNTESLKRYAMTVARIQTIFWHLYAVKQLFVVDLFTMDTDERSFKKMKDIVKKLNFTSLFKNTYSEAEAKTVTINYILEVLLETNDMLSIYTEEVFGLEKGPQFGTFQKPPTKPSAGVETLSVTRQEVSEAISRTHETTNRMDTAMADLERMFVELRDQEV